jgi:DNA-cytosine methyltransferase
MIRIATVFSGVGTPEWALKQMGVEYKCVFACDNDKYARQTFEANHAAEHYFTDVTTLDGKQFKNDVRIFVGGSPCQAFSIAGKRGGFEDTRGTLFYEYARLVKEIQPRIFVWENVKGVLSHDGGKTWKTICNTFNELGYYAAWKVLNTKHYGVPQNRERVYVVGFKDFEDYNNFSFPEKLRLKDLLETGVDKKYYLSDKMMKLFENYQSGNHKFSLTDKNGVSKLLNSRQHKMGADDTYVEDTITAVPHRSDDPFKDDNIAPTVRNSDKGEVRVIEPSIINTNMNGDARNHEFCGTLRSNASANYMTVIEPAVLQINQSKESGGKQPYQQNRVYDENGLSPALQNLSAGGNAILTSEPKVICHNMLPRSSKTGKGGTGHLKRDDGLCYTLDTGKTNAIEVVLSEPRHKHGEDREYTDGIAPAIQARHGTGGDNVPYVNKIRRLTPRECANLQGFSKDFVLPCSDTQSYKQMGNGMSVNVLVELFRCIFEKKNEQFKLF